MVFGCPGLDERFRPKMGQRAPPNLRKTSTSIHCPPSGAINSALASFPMGIVNKVELARDPNTSPEILSMLITDEDEEVRLLVSLNESTPEAALYPQVDFDEVRSMVNELRLWYQAVGGIDEIDEEESIKYSPLQVWSEIHNDDDVIRTSGLSRAAHCFFVSHNSPKGERWDLDPVTVAIVLDCDIHDPTHWDEYTFEGYPRCCGGCGRIIIDLDELLEEDSDESIINSIEWLSLS